MKTDPLEDFMKKNREGFDFLEPSPYLFEKITLNEKKSKKIPLYSSLLKIAIAAAIFVAGFFLSKSLYFNNNQSNESFQHENIPALYEARLYYSNLIDQKYHQILTLTQNDPQIENELKSAFSEIENEYKVLSHDLNDDVMNKEIIEVMIQSYRLKLGILEDMLDQMKSIYDIEKEEEVDYEI